MVGQRKSPGQPVIEGQILAGPVGHGRGLVALGRGLLGRGHETVHLAAGPLRVAGAPALAGHAVLLHGGARVIGPDHSARGVGILGIRRAVVPEREPLPPAEGAEVVVEGVVLQHQDDDVLDLRQHVRAGRTGGIGPVAGPGGARPPLPLAQLPPFDPLPGARAGHVSPPSAALAASRTQGRSLARAAPPANRRPAVPVRSYPPIPLSNGWVDTRDADRRFRSPCSSDRSRADRTATRSRAGHGTDGPEKRVLRWPRRTGGLGWARKPARSAPRRIMIPNGPGATACTASGLG